MFLGCVVVLLGFVAASLAVAADDAKTEKKPVKTANAAVIVMKGAMAEGVSQPGLFGELGPNLSGMIDRLDRAAKDEEISAVVLRLRNPSIGRGKLAELRAAIARTRKAGKTVVADVHVASAADYLLACACDEIVMPESGSVMIPGVRAEVTFYKGLLDKVGIKADFLQVGDFKGAAEPMTRTGMSDEFRQQYDALIGDVFDQMVETIAADRKLDPKKVRELIDTGLLSPAAAKEAGLIDTVAYADEFAENLKKKLKVDQVAFHKKYGKKKVDTDFSGMLGMIKLIELMMGVEPTKRASKNKKIAVVYAVGPIMTGESTTSLFGLQTLGSDTVVKALRTAGDDKTVAAIILRVDSPGGSALASDLIWREIQRVRAKKPVLASMGDTAASGGYYISMGCDKIYAEPGTLTGSIGVVGGKLVLGGLYDKVGLKTEIISRGRNSGLLSAEAPFSDSERKVWQKMLDEVYRQFTTKAAEGRKMDVKKLDGLAQGRVFTGRQAKKNGLVDELGTLEDAVQAARKLAGITASQKTELLILPKPTSFFDQLFGGPDASAAFGKAAGQIAPDVARHVGDIATIRRLFAEPAVLILPYRVEIR